MGGGSRDRTYGVDQLPTLLTVAELFEEIRFEECRDCCCWPTKLLTGARGDVNTKLHTEYLGISSLIASTNPYLAQRDNPPLARAYRIQVPSPCRTSVDQDPARKHLWFLRFRTVPRFLTSNLCPKQIPSRCSHI